MQPVPGCRTRVWKREWRQTVGSQTSLTTGTRRIANRVEQRSGRSEEARCVRRAKDQGTETEGWEAERLMADRPEGRWLGW